MNEPMKALLRRVAELTKDFETSMRQTDDAIKSAQTAIVGWRCERGAREAAERERDQLREALARLLDSTDPTHTLPGIRPDGSVSEAQSMARTLAREALAGSAGPQPSWPDISKPEIRG